MASSRAPSDAKAAAGIAMAACALAGRDPEKSKSLMGLALDFDGGDARIAAAAAAVCGVPALLDMALERGVPADSMAELAPLSLDRPLPGCPEEASLMRLAMISGDSECCRLLAKRGADPLAEVGGKKKSALWRDSEIAAAYPWDCALAALEASKPGKAAATGLALEMMYPLMESFSPRFDAKAMQPQGALSMVERLCDLGADWTYRAAPGKKSLSSLLVSGAALKMFWRAEPRGLVDHLGALCVMASRVDPLSSPERLAGLLAAQPAGYGPTGEHTESELRNLIQAQALACSANNPAALTVLAYGQSVAAKPSGVEKARADVVALDWMALGAPEWVAPGAAVLEKCKELIAENLLESAKLQRGSKTDFSESWLEMALARERKRAGWFEGRLQMECAIVAAASHPELGAAYEAAARSALHAAKENAGEEEWSAIKEAAVLAALSAKADARSGPGPVRV